MLVLFRHAQKGHGHEILFSYYKDLSAFSRGVTTNV